MPEDLKISLMTEASDSSLGDNHYFTGYRGTANFQVSWTNMKKATLGIVGGIARTIGLNSAGSIMTIDAAQTVTNKTFVNPIVNGIAVTVAGTVINYLSGLTSNLQNQLNSIIGRIATNEANIAIQKNKSTELMFSIQATPTHDQFIIDSNHDEFNGVQVNAMSISCKLYKYEFGGLLSELPTTGLQICYENNIMTAIRFPIATTGVSHIFVIKYRKYIQESVTPSS